jgi:tetratricopeptide (TPR) repeat protein
MPIDLFQNAVAHHQRGLLIEAEALYRQLLATEPNNAQCLHYLGVVALQRGQNETAIELIARSLGQDENNAEAHFNIGLAYAALGRMTDVERHNRRAVSIKPDHADAHANLGNALNALGLRCDRIMPTHCRTSEPHLDCVAGWIMPSRRFGACLNSVRISLLR